MSLALDHVVVVADTLEQGASWCVQTLGIEPGPGGRHALMGTHNRLFAIGSPTFPRAYLEIIAIDPDAALPGRARWFGMDDPAQRTAVGDEPRLLHWVARTDSLMVARSGIDHIGLDAGIPITASRGALSWRITVRPDGTLLCQGALPTLIEWGTTHPADTMPASGVTLDALVLRGVPRALAADLPPGASLADDAGTPIEAVFTTPRGSVRLLSWRAPR